MRNYPQILKNVKVKEKRDLATVPEITRRIAEIERELGENGRLLVRYSGTESKLRIMLEGQDEGAIRRYADDLAGLVLQTLG
jgi:phosphoglucosamine mutase